MLEILTHQPWPIYCVISAVIMSLYFTVSKIYARALNPFVYSMVVNAGGLVCSVGLFCLVYGDASLLKTDALSVGIPVMMGLSFVLIDIGFLKSYAAGYEVTFVVPFVRTLLTIILVAVGILFFGETLSWLNVAGLVLSVAGIKLIYAK